MKIQYYARELRRSATDAERMLWRKLRDRRFHGVKFRRQVHIGSYIADFCSLETKIIVELDGGGHAETMSYDIKRDHFLRMNGFTVLRFENHLIWENMSWVLDVIHGALTPTLSRKRERGASKGDCTLSEFPL